jgi:hypothetical protein
MASALDRLKKQLSIDQRNRLQVQVLTVAGNTCTVRLPDGGVKTAGLGADTLAPGDVVDVATDGRTYTVERIAPVASLDGERIVTITY